MKESEFAQLAEKRLELTGEPASSDDEEAGPSTRKSKGDNGDMNGEDDAQDDAQDDSLDTVIVQKTSKELVQAAYAEQLDDCASRDMRRLLASSEGLEELMEIMTMQPARRTSARKGGASDAVLPRPSKLPKLPNPPRRTATADDSDSSGDDEDAPDKGRAKMTMQLRSAYIEINEPTETPQLLHAVKMTPKEKSEFKADFEKQLELNASYRKQQATKGASTHSSTTARNRGTKNRHTNYAKLQSAQARVANSISYVNTLNRKLVGPEQLRQMQDNITPQALAKMFKRSKLNTLAGLHTRGGEHFHRHSAEALAITRKTATKMWDRVYADASRTDGSPAARAGRDVAMQRLKKAQSYTHKPYKLRLPLLQDTPPELDALVLAEIDKAISDIVVDGDERYVSLFVGVDPDRPDVGVMAGTWTFARIQALFKRVLQFHRDHKNPLDCLSILTALHLLEGDVASEGGHTNISVLSPNVRDHVLALIKEGVDTLSYKADAGTEDGTMVYHTPSQQYRLGEASVAPGTFLAASLTVISHTATDARNAGATDTSAVQPTRGMHILHNIAVVLMILLIIEESHTYRHPKTTVPARLTLACENVAMMIEGTIPLSETACLIALYARCSENSHQFCSRKISYKSRGVLKTDVMITPARLHTMFASELNVEMGLVQRLQARLGLNPLCKYLPELVEDHVDAVAIAEHTSQLQSQVSALADVVRASFPHLTTERLLDIFLYASPVRDRSIAAMAARALVQGLCNGAVARTLGVVTLSRAQMVGVIAAAASVVMYIKNTVVLPLLGSKQYFLHPDECRCARYQQILARVHSILGFNLLAPCEDGLASSNMRLCALRRGWSSEVGPLQRCATAAMSTYFQTEVMVSHDLPLPLAQKVSGALESAAAVSAPPGGLAAVPYGDGERAALSVPAQLAAGMLTTAESVGRATDAAVKRTKETCRAGFKLLVRKKGKRRRHLLGNWKTSLATLSNGRWCTLASACRAPATTMGILFDAIQAMLHKRGSGAFLCLKHLRNHLTFGAFDALHSMPTPSAMEAAAATAEATATASDGGALACVSVDTTAAPSKLRIYDALSKSVFGPGSFKMSYGIDQILTGKCSWADALKLKANAMRTGLLPYAICEVYETVPAIMPLLVLPAWEQCVALDPALDDLTPDAAPYLACAQASSQGDSILCEGLARGGLSAARSQGLVASDSNVKAGITKDVYYANASERDLDYVEVETLQDDGTIALCMHRDLRAGFSGHTAATLALKYSSVEAQHARRAVHERAKVHSLRLQRQADQAECVVARLEARAVAMALDEAMHTFALQS